MNTKVKAIILIGVSAAMIAVVLFWPRQSSPRYNWDVHDLKARPGEPYSVDLFDQFLTRSLDHGYSLRSVAYHWDKDLNDDYFSDYLTISDITEASTDTALLVANRQPWEAPRVHESSPYGDLELVAPTLSMLVFASQGGTALYAEIPYSDDAYYFSHDVPVNVLISFLEAKAAIKVHFGDDYMAVSDTNGDRQPYTPAWYRHRPNEPLRLICGDSTITFNGKYAPNYFVVDWDMIDALNMLRDGLLLRPMLYTEPRDGESRAYMIDFYFPESGGHLYVTTLSLLFTNLGLTLDNGPEVLETIMDPIDSRPVSRLVYTRDGVYADSDGTRNPLAVVSRNPSLSFAWILVLVFVACMFLTGAMRRHPVSRAAMIDDVDMTDQTAVREAKFRKSPLLHFLYQCSRLFKRNTDHRDIFDVNVRHISRRLERNLNIELMSATPEQLQRASQHFGREQDRPADQVLQELEWLRNRCANSEPVSAKEFARSQKIAQRYR